MLIVNATPIVIQKALSDLTHASMLKLVEVDEAAQMLLSPYSDTIKTLLTGERQVIERMILRGKEWCGSDKEEDGRAILIRAWNYLEAGLGDYVYDRDEKKAEVRNAIDACSPVVINVAPEKAVVYDIAMSEDSGDTYTDIEVEVLGNSQQAMEDETVYLSLSHVGDPVYDKNLGNEQTDINGKAIFRFGYGKFYMPEGDYIVIATVNHDGKLCSGLEHIELKRIKFKLTYSYTYNYSHTWTGGANTLSAAYTSSGTRNAQDKAGCALVDQELTQNSWYESGGYTNSTTHTLLPLNQSANVLGALSVAMRSPVYSKMERVDVYLGVTDIDVIYQDVVDYFSLVYPPYPETLEVILDREGDGFTSYSYSGQTPDGYGTGTVLISASIED